MGLIERLHLFDHAGLMMVTAENFNVVYQNFKVGSDHTAFETGRIVNIKRGGYKVGKVKYEIPKHILTPNFDYDDKLLNSLQEIKKRKPKFFRIIVRATDALMNSYKNSDDVSYESRILEQARAFEILFNLPDHDQRKEFKDKIEKYCALKDERKRWYKSERFNKKVVEVGTKHKMWADRFYTLRNHIIHGEVIRNKEYIFSGQRHYDIALWFFIASVKQLINEGLKSKIFYDVVKFESGKFKYESQHIRQAVEQAMKELNLNLP
jgi:hypothetical protein